MLDDRLIFFHDNLWLVQTMFSLILLTIVLVCRRAACSCCDATDGSPPNQMSSFWTVLQAQCLAACAAEVSEVHVPYLLLQFIVREMNLNVHCLTIW